MPKSQRATCWRPKQRKCARWSLSQPLSLASPQPQEFCALLLSGRQADWIHALIHALIHAFSWHLFLVFIESPTGCSGAIGVVAPSWIKAPPLTKRGLCGSGSCHHPRDTHLEGQPAAIIREMRISRVESDVDSCCSNSTGISTGRVQPRQHSRPCAAACIILRRRGERATSSSSLRSTESEAVSFERGECAGSSAMALLESNAIENDSSLALRRKWHTQAADIDGAWTSAHSRSEAGDSSSIASSERRSDSASMAAMTWVT